MLDRMLEPSRAKWGVATQMWPTGTVAENYGDQETHLDRLSVMKSCTKAVDPSPNMKAITIGM